MTADELEQALRQTPPTFAREALEVAMSDAEMALPVAHRLLAETVTVARDGVEDRLGFGPIYVLYLLSHHRDQTALETLAELARLPGDDDYRLLGDLITDDMCAVLWSLSGDDPDRLFALADDPATEPFWVDAALRAITIGVAKGVLDREQMLDAVRHRLEAEIEMDRSEGEAVGMKPTWLVTTLAVLDVGDDKTLPDTACDSGLVDVGYIDLGAWHDRAPTTHEEAITLIERIDGWRYPVDPLRLSRWACFNPGDISNPKDTPALDSFTEPAREKKKKRTKAKAQRKARKRNRARKR
jgi:hypothetical protein